MRIGPFAGCCKLKAFLFQFQVFTESAIGKKAAIPVPEPVTIGVKTYAFCRID